MYSKHRRGRREMKECCKFPICSDRVTRSECVVNCYNPDGVDYLPARPPACHSGFGGLDQPPLLLQLLLLHAVVVVVVFVGSVVVWRETHNGCVCYWRLVSHFVVCKSLCGLPCTAYVYRVRALVSSSGRLLLASVNDKSKLQNVKCFTDRFHTVP